MNSSGFIHRDSFIGMRMYWDGAAIGRGSPLRHVFPSLRLPCLHARPLAHSANPNKRNAHSNSAARSSRACSDRRVWESGHVGRTKK